MQNNIHDLHLIIISLLLVLNPAKNTAVPLQVPNNTSYTIQKIHFVVKYVITNNSDSEIWKYIDIFVNECLCVWPKQIPNAPGISDFFWPMSL